MTLSELRSWCNRASFCDDKEVIIEVNDVDETTYSINKIIITKDFVIFSAE